MLKQIPQLSRPLGYIIALLLMLPLPSYMLFSPTKTDAHKEFTSANPRIQTAVEAYGYPKALHTSSPLEITPDSQTSSSFHISSDSTVILTSADTASTSLPTTSTPFTITIPKIGLSHGITLNVDPTDKNEYLHILQTHVAHGEGTALPSTLNGNTYLFAHSKSTYNDKTPPGGWFTRIDELRNGDTIIITYNGITYSYTVASQEIVDPSDTTVYQAVSPFEGHRSLTLQTCYPRGSTGKRLIVYAIGE